MSFKNIRLEPTSTRVLNNWKKKLKISSKTVKSNHKEPLPKKPIKIPPPNPIITVFDNNSLVM